MIENKRFSEAECNICKKVQKFVFAAEQYEDSSHKKRLFDLHICSECGNSKAFNPNEEYLTYTSGERV